MTKFEVKPADRNGYVFVNGETKYLHECNDDDLALLRKNGDKRVIRVKTAPVDPPKTDETKKS